MLATNPNVYCKLSGLITEADWSNWCEDDLRPYLDAVFDAFGPDRLMFGSDCPVCLLAGNYGHTAQVIQHYISGLPPAQQEKIFALNAAKFYRLGISDRESATAG